MKLWLGGNILIAGLLFAGVVWSFSFWLMLAVLPVLLIVIAGLYRDMVVDETRLAEIETLETLYRAD